jgi:hypothetical protein
MTIENTNQTLFIANGRRCVCPKCKSSDLLLTELWKNHSIQFDYKNGQIVSKGNAECGNPYKVEAFCNKCKHEWRLKGVIQISEVSNHI